MVHGITVVDRYTVQVTLQEAFTPFVSLLAVGHAKIVPRELVEQYGEAFGTRPIGTGPFKFIRWGSGTRDRPWPPMPSPSGGAPRLSEVREYRIFPGEPV